jgi:hypothetical protein
MVCREDLMIRFGKALALIAICGALCHCSSRPDAIRTELRQPPVKDADVLELPVARRGIEPAARNNLGDVTSSIGRPGDIRPWPKRGTPEWDQLQAEEIAREQRIKEVLSSICRGC